MHVFQQSIVNSTGRTGEASDITENMSYRQ